MTHMCTLRKTFARVLSCIVWRCQPLCVQYMRGATENAFGAAGERHPSPVELFFEHNLGLRAGAGPGDVRICQSYTLALQVSWEAAPAQALRLATPSQGAAAPQLARSGPSLPTLSQRQRCILRLLSRGFHEPRLGRDTPLA
jgi:hypothetical protein